MPTKKSDIPQDIFQLKVTLLGTTPPIWRRLLVPAEMTLAQLHHVLQAAMGWDDSHMHEFRVGQQRYGMPDPDARLMGMPPVTNERSVRLSTVLGRMGAKARYAYDFGDGWEHSFVLEKRLAADPNLVYPTCTDGRRACPPEDCGGVGGFYALLEAISDPNHDQHEEMREWVGDDYDPEVFSIADVNLIIEPSPRHRGRASK